MFLITSAEYVEMQLRAEIGDIPPAFLPIGNRRLFEYQLEIIQHPGPRAISLPADFVLPPQDQRRFDEAGVNVLRPPPGLSLAQSIAWCIRTDPPPAGVEILHGDTLFDALPAAGSPPHAVSVAHTNDHYNWAAVERLNSGRLRIRHQFAHGDASQQVLTGWFRFDCVETLLEALAASRSFTDAIERYSMEHEIHCVVPPHWRDLGHASTFLRVRADHTRERAFNKLRSNGRSIVKTGPRTKILGEAEWFRDLPTPLRVFTPLFLGAREDDGQLHYELEYLYLLTLSDLYVFGALPAPVWSAIFGSCEDAFSAFRRYGAPSPEAVRPEALLLDKTLSRLDQFAADTGFDLDAELTINGCRTPGVRAIAHAAARSVPPLPAAEICWIHGDPCFSNIFYDFRAMRVKLVDPRGTDAHGATCPWGDPRYDLAKLAHSAYGYYDMIVSDRFHLEVGSKHDFQFGVDYTPSMLHARDAFLQTRFGRWRGDDEQIQGIVILLFLSMLPLHADTPVRQQGFIANALALHHWLIEGEDIR